MRKTQITADWSNVLGRARPAPAPDAQVVRGDDVVEVATRQPEGLTSDRPSSEAPPQSASTSSIHTSEDRAQDGSRTTTKTGRGPNRNAYLVEDLYVALLDHLDRKLDAGVRTNQTRVIEAALEGFFAAGPEGDDRTLRQLLEIASKTAARKVAVPYRLSGHVEDRIENYWRALKRRRVETRRTISRTDIVELALARFLRQIDS